MAHNSKNSIDPFKGSKQLTHTPVTNRFASELISETSFDSLPPESPFSSTASPQNSQSHVKKHLDYAIALERAIQKLDKWAVGTRDWKTQYPAAYQEVVSSVNELLNVTKGSLEALKLLEYDKLDLLDENHNLNKTITELTKKMTDNTNQTGTHQTVENITKKLTEKIDDSFRNMDFITTKITEKIDSNLQNLKTDLLKNYQSTASGSALKNSTNSLSICPSPIIDHSNKNRNIISYADIAKTRIVNPKAQPVSVHRERYKQKIAEKTPQEQAELLAKFDANLANPKQVNYAEKSLNIKMVYVENFQWQKIKSIRETFFDQLGMDLKKINGFRWAHANNTHGKTILEVLVKEDYYDQFKNNLPAGKYIIDFNPRIPINKNLSEANKKIFQKEWVDKMLAMCCKSIIYSSTRFYRMYMRSLGFWTPEMDREANSKDPEYEGYVQRRNIHQASINTQNQDKNNISSQNILNQVSLDNSVQNLHERNIFNTTDISSTSSNNGLFAKEISNSRADSATLVSDSLSRSEFGSDSNSQ